MLNKTYKLIGVILFAIIFFCGIAYAKSNLKVQVVGIENDMKANVEARLNVVQKLYGNKLSADQVKKVYQQGPAEIRKAMQPYGYFNPVINSKLRFVNGTWTAYYVIKQGLPVRIESLHIVISGPGKTNKKIMKFIQHFPLQEGQTFNVVSYEKVKADLFELSNNQGYIKSTFVDTKIVIDPHKKTARIHLQLDTGQRYYFGRVNFSPSPYDCSFLQRFIGTLENQPFSSKKLIELEQKMAASSYFTRVAAKPDYDHIEDYHVPIIITVVPPKSQKYNIGLGYGTFTGPRLTAGVSLRRVTSTGHQFDAQMRLSRVLTNFAAKYSIPGFNPITDQWVMGANAQRFIPQNASSSSFRIYGGYESKFDRFAWNTNLNYLLERYKVYDDPKTTSEMLFPRFKIMYLKADNVVTPHWGRSLTLNLQGAAKNLFSSTSFIQSRVRGKFIFEPLSFSRVILRGDLGYTAVQDLTRLPATLRFYAGELNGLRGFPDSSIGPGKYLMIASAEYQNRIKGNLYGAIFCDIGRAADEWNSPINRGAGLGLVYDSPLGPIKLYWARALSKPDRPNSIEFSIGPEF